MICFHFTIFVVLETTAYNSASRSGSCDLLSFYYLCRTWNNSPFAFQGGRRLWFAFILLSLSYLKQLLVADVRAVLVVICFHFTIFVVLETTTGHADGAVHGCDLLSFYYLCRTWNNGAHIVHAVHVVVICFHFTIFVVLETTDPPARHLGARCDLLSFYYLCRTWNNIQRRTLSYAHVVICFHFTIFVVLETTTRVIITLSFRLWFAFILLSLSYLKQPAAGAEDKPAWLWFAFILLSLSYLKQHTDVNGKPRISCDLLSFYYLCRTWNNTINGTLVQKMLWFAFILLSLSYLKQHILQSARFEDSCDLLSFYYLCRTWNNNGV